MYQEHPDWFLKADAIIFDLTQPQVVDYLTEQVTRLVRTYDLRWMKLDYNTNMLPRSDGQEFLPLLSRRAALSDRDPPPQPHVQL